VSAPVLEVRGLSKRFGAVAALKGIDLTVAEGGIYGFIGPNGAGKTTAIRIVAGLLRPTSGTVRLDGLDLVEDRLRAATGLRTLVEVPAFYPGLTGAENLAIFARLARAPRSQVRMLLEALGLEAAADRAVAGYSLGMRQRLGIAQALVGRPRLVVLDEPMNGLDPAAIRLVRELVRAVRREEGVSFLISSHLLHDVETICDVVGILHRGELVEQGRIDDLLEGRVTGYRFHTLDDARALRALEQSGISGKPRRDDEGGLRIDGDESVLPALHRALLAAGTPTRELEPLGPSLERHFLERTEGVMG